MFAKYHESGCGLSFHVRFHDSKFALGSWYCALAETTGSSNNTNVKLTNYLIKFCIILLNLRLALVVFTHYYKKGYTSGTKIVKLFSLKKGEMLKFLWSTVF